MIDTAAVFAGNVWMIWSVVGMYVCWQNVAAVMKMMEGVE